jgi:Domain of unknown function (DUF4397)
MNIRRMTSTFGVLLATSTAGLVALGPSTNAAATASTTQAYLRIVHASPDAPAVDVLLDGKEIAKDAAFKAVTPFMEVREGPHKLVITQHGDAKKIVLERNLELRPGRYYTVAAAGMLKDIRAVEFMATSLKLSSTMARVNVYHLSPDAPRIDLIDVDRNMTRIARDLRYERVASALLRPTSLNLHLTEASKQPVLKELKGAVVSADKSYSLFAFGLAAGKDKEALELLLVEDKVEAMR